MDACKREQKKSTLKETTRPMSYLGGKCKNADHIVAVLNSDAYDGMQYLEPFVGYCHVLRRVRNKASYAASDANALLLALLTGVQQNAPLPEVTRERYDVLRRTDEITLERGVAAFTYSFNGKEWGGYTSSYTRRSGRVDDIPGSRRRYYDALRANDTFKQTRLECRDYRELTPRDMLIYCDPPYAGTTPYGKRTFDSDEFWEVMRRWSKNNVVFVSEYTAPDDFVCVASADKKSCVGGGHTQRNRVERLFVYEPQITTPLACAR